MVFIFETFSRFSQAWIQSIAIGFWLIFVRFFFLTQFLMCHYNTKLFIGRSPMNTAMATTKVMVANSKNNEDGQRKRVVAAGDAWQMRSGKTTSLPL